jgi:hypothetical protein
VQFDEALTLHLMAELGMAYEDRTPDELERDSARVFESLGVVDALELLPAADPGADRDVARFDTRASAAKA